MLSQLYDALRAGNVPDDETRAAAEEVADYEGELVKLRLEIAERFRDTGERRGRVESDLRLLKWMVGFLTAEQLGTLAPGLAIPVETAVMTEAITFTLDGRGVDVRLGETIWQLAAREGIDPLPSRPSRLMVSQWD